VVPAPNPQDDPRYRSPRHPDDVRLEGNARDLPPPRDALGRVKVTLPPGRELEDPPDPNRDISGAALLQRENRIEAKGGSRSGKRARKKTGGGGSFLGYTLVGRRPIEDEPRSDVTSIRRSPDTKAVFNEATSGPDRTVTITATFAFGESQSLNDLQRQFALAMKGKIVSGYQESLTKSQTGDKVNSSQDQTPDLKHTNNASSENAGASFVSGTDHAA
jgi:hypothetical protein